ncbi:unnamed protein product [Psylliodes chrysocephalus]|uniref:Uncharacterized protein n=1 Tax=Psylliodes chrysocephalus TaxID=3402493 RepID=A0A9P0CES8_9CUCU|nr:unnamed protein product [Psylliodes chrysocephala]
MALVAQFVVSPFMEIYLQQFATCVMQNFGEDIAATEMEVGTLVFSYSNVRSSSHVTLMISPECVQDLKVGGLVLLQETDKIVYSSPPINVFLTRISLSVVILPPPQQQIAWLPRPGPSGKPKQTSMSISTTAMNRNRPMNPRPQQPQQKFTFEELYNIEQYDENSFEENAGYNQEFFTEEQEYQYEEEKVFQEDPSVNPEI